MKSIAMWRDIGRFILRKRSASLVVSMVLVLLLSVSLLGWLRMDAIGKAWSDDWEPLINLSTFLVACLVWWGETRQDWLTNMPDKLTAIFTYEGREVMRCELANLAAESDIRALGQQLGMHMNDNKLLHMVLPKIQRSGGLPEENKGGEIYRHWTAVFPLLSMPEVMIEAAEDEVLLWVPPFSEKPRLVRCVS